MAISSVWIWRKTFQITSRMPLGTAKGSNNHLDLLAGKAKEPRMARAVDKVMGKSNSTRPTAPNLEAKGTCTCGIPMSQR